MGAPADPPPAAADPTLDLSAAWRLAYIATGDQATATEATTRAFAQVAARDAGGAPSPPELLHVTLLHGLRAAADQPHAAPDEDRTSAVTTAMWQLPPNQRAALWLTQVDERDDTELGQILGLSPANAEHVAKRAAGWLDVALDHGSGPLCEHEAQLSAFADGRLPLVEAAEIDDHLPGCPTCQSKLNAFEELADLPVVLSRAVPRPPANLTAEALERPPPEDEPLDAGPTAGGPVSPPAVRPLAVCCAALLALGLLGALILRPARSSRQPVSTINAPAGVAPVSPGGSITGGGPTTTSARTSTVKVTTTTLQPAVTFPTLPHR